MISEAPRLSFCVGALLLLGLQPLLAAEHVLAIDNRVGKFQAFYASATTKTPDPDSRFKLWEKGDGLAAVPPGPDGDTMARQLFKIALAHELMHSIHLQLIKAKNSFGAPVGETMFLEGLAMRVSQRAVQGLPDTAYTAMPDDNTWWRECVTKKRSILKGILPDIDKSGPDIAMKYTFGHGNTGMQREAYCAAWFVMGKLIDSGKTLPELARIPEDQIVSTIRAAMTD